MNVTSEPSFISASKKMSRLAGLFNKVLASETENSRTSLDDLIEDMVSKDPKLLCRLNFKNPEVKRKVKKLLDEGRINLSDLMHEPKDTIKVKPKVRLAKRTKKRKTNYRETQRILVKTQPEPVKRGKKMVSVSTDCDAWLDELDRRWAEQAKDSSESGVFEAICA